MQLDVLFSCIFKLIKNRYKQMVDGQIVTLNFSGAYLEIVCAKGTSQLSKVSIREQIFSIKQKIDLSSYFAMSQGVSFKY